MTNFISNPNQSEFFNVDILKNDLQTFEDIELAVSKFEEFVISCTKEEIEFDLIDVYSLIFSRLKDSVYTLIGNAKDSENEITDLQSKITNQLETIDDLNEIISENETEINDLKNELEFYKQKCNQVKMILN